MNNLLSKTFARLKHATMAATYFVPFRSISEFNFPISPTDHGPYTVQAFTLSLVLSFGYIGIGSFDLLNLHNTLNLIQANENRSNGQLMSFFTPNGQLRCPWRANKRFCEAPGVDAAAIVVAASAGVAEQADIYSFGMLCIGRVGAFSPSPISSSSFSFPFRIRVDMCAGQYAIAW